MFVEVAEINRLKDTDSIYLLVHFWRSEADALAGDPPLLTNDFIMQLRRTGERVVTDAEGNQGVETFTLSRAELFADVRANVVAYMRRAREKRLTGDHTGDASKPLFVNGKRVVQRVSQVFERDNVNDSDGVLAQLRTFRGRREEVGE